MALPTIDELDKEIKRMQKSINKLEKAIAEILARLNDRNDVDAYGTCWSIVEGLNKP